MSPFDVHYNRAPLDGTVSFVRHHPGRGAERAHGADALAHPDAPPAVLRGSAHIVRNERMVTRIDGTFRRHAAAAATSCRSQRRRSRESTATCAGQAVERGAIFGMIRIGSQVDIVVPWRDDLAVRVAGDRVARGRRCSSHDALARLNVIAPSWGCQRAAVASRPPSAPLLRKDPMANDTRGEFPLHARIHHDTNSSGNESFASVLDKRLSRRSLLKGTAGLAAGTLMSGSLGRNDDTTIRRSPSSSTSRRWPRASRTRCASRRLHRDGAVPARRSDRRRRRGLRNNGTDAAAIVRAARRRPSRRHALLRPRRRRQRTTPNASDRGLLVHEPRGDHAALPARERARPSSNGAAHRGRRGDQGDQRARRVSVIEVAKAATPCSYKQRLAVQPPHHHADRHDALAGPPPVRAHDDHQVTRPTARRTRGTVNNCANGYTPWGTYLTCEENWAGYFRRVTATDNPKRTAKELASFSRYGVAGTGRELWATVDAADPADTTFARWNAEKLGASADGSDDFRNVANTYGWVVEIDPFAPTSTPRKRTALGRFAHEGAWLGPVVAGQAARVVHGRRLAQRVHLQVRVERGLGPGRRQRAGSRPATSTSTTASSTSPSSTPTAPALARAGVRPQRHHRRLTRPTPSPTRPTSLVNTRLAADAAGATKMDRPEWGAVNPHNGEIYMTLTNNNAALAPAGRHRCRQSALLQRSDDDAAPRRRGNPNGHIIRLAEDGGDPAATDVQVGHLPVRRARRRANAANVNVSGLTADNDFSSPDGCWFSKRAASCGSRPTTAPTPTSPTA